MCMSFISLCLGRMQVVFPAAHVCQRLEQAAAGLWPEAGSMAPDEGSVQETMLRVSSTHSTSRTASTCTRIAKQQQCNMSSRAVLDT